MSMCSASLRELSNPGASGSIFYLTDDDEFIIKTVMHKEGEFLQKLLPGYYMVNFNPTCTTMLSNEPILIKSSLSELEPKSQDTVAEVLRLVLLSLQQ